MKSIFALATLLGCAVGLCTSSAAEATLKVGDPAPKLQTGKFVQGEPVKEFAPGKAYLVEFWATWCGPCRVTIPHLNELHNKYKDKGLIIIGQNCWERDESKVEGFVKQMGDKMTYRVALDDKQGSESGKMAETWMEAAGQDGIPAAFLVDTKGRIAWIGHPMNLKESYIDDVLAGKFDVKKAAQQAEQDKARQTELTKLSSELNNAFREKDWDKAAKVIDQVEPLLNEEQRRELALPRAMVKLGQKDVESAAAIAAKTAEAPDPNPVILNSLAWELATFEGIKGQPLSTAETLANKANELTKGNEPAILDTLARIHFLKGDKNKAVDLEQKAVDLAEGELKDALKRSLESYQAGKLPDTF